MELSTKQDQLFNLFSSAKASGVNYLEVENFELNDEFIKIKGKKVYNFGNCGYLALERNQRIKDNSIAYIGRYGSMYPSSRSFSALKALAETENELAKIFERPVLLANTTGLCHIAAIPLLAGPNDLILLDKQVHKTVTNAAMIAKAQGTVVATITHNNLAELEDEIVKSSHKYNKIWYMADSIYSMFGDSAPLVELRALLIKYDHFHLYFDDAHGMSWTGKNGSGFVRSQINWHPRLFMATSFQKGFGAFGAALVLPDEETKNQIKYLGSTFIFCGPPTPSTLGAILASTKIHLSDEIYQFQNQLNSLLQHFISTCDVLNLPIVSKSISPVFFIGIGDEEKTILASKLLIDRGFFVNCCGYPAVPKNNAGLRITITLHHNKYGISQLLNEIALIFNELNLNSSEIENKYHKIKEFELLEV